VEKHKLDGWLVTIALILIGLLVTRATRAFADAEDLTFEKPGQTSQEDLGVPPPAPDPLWTQVNACIQKAIVNNNFGPIPIPPKPKTGPWVIPTCIQVFRPNDVNAQIGQGFTILKDKDPKKPNGFLTVASKVITGIDDPQVNFFFSAKPVLPLPLPASLVSSSYSRNYWAQAWAALDYTVNKMYQLDPTRVHPGMALGPGQMGLAVNSIAGRTSNQLHIHMSCINKAVRETLTSNMATITSTKWTKIQIPVSPTAKRSYSVILLPDLNQNPFLVMYTEGPITPEDETLVVTGKPGTTNYYLLEDYAHSGDIGEGEELLDQTCASWP